MLTHGVRLVRSRLAPAAAASVAAAAATVVVAGGLVATAAAAAPDRAGTPQVSGVTGHVASHTTAGTKIKVDFVVTNHSGARSNGGTASLSLVGAGHSYSLGSATYPALKNGGSRPISVTNLPSPRTTTGDYVVRVCLPPRPAGPCAESGTVTVHIGPPELTAPKTLTMPATLLGKTSAARSVTVTNTGQSVTGIISLTIAGPDATGFALSTRGCHVSLSPGKACAPTLVFTPQHSGVSTATMTLTGTQGARTTATVTLTGTGTNPTVLTVDPTTFAFPDTPVGQTSSTPIEVTNTSNAVTGTLKVALSGSGAGQYIADANGCGPTIPAGGSCTIQVQFHPTVAGDATATLTVTADPGGTATTTLTGRTPPAGGGTLTIDPTSHDFGGVNDNTHASFPFTLKNNAGTATGTMAIQLAGPQASFYTLDIGTCGPGLAAGASCTVTVTFNPTGNGPTTATLAVTPATGSPVNASLSGNQLTPAFLQVTPGSYDFGSVTVGGNNVHVFTISNAGGQASGTVTVSLGTTSDFLITVNNCTGPLAANATCSVTVRFAPTSAGSKGVTLTASANPGSPGTATLTGTGT